MEVLACEHAFRHRSRVVEGRRPRIGLGSRRIVTERRAEIQRGHLRNRRRGRIEKQLVEIEAMSLRRIVWTIHPVGVELPRPDTPDPHVPHVPGAVERGIQIDDLCRDGMCRAAEQLQPHTGCVAAEEREVDATVDFTGARGQGNASPQFASFADLGQIGPQSAFARPGAHRCHTMKGASSGMLAPARNATMRGV